MTVRDSKTPGEAGVCAAALPVLARHISSARSQAEQAVRTLNQHFMAVMRQLQEMSSLAEALHQGGAAAFERIDAAFMTLAEAHAATSREQSQLAQRGAQLAPQLSAVLASARAAGTPELVTQLESVITEVFGLIDAHQQLAEAAAVSTQHTELRIDAVLAPYGESIYKLAQYGDSMRAEVGECMVHLQFQDRTSQILGHVTASMEQLTHYLQPVKQPVSESARSFLNHIWSGYTTAEQHENHCAVVGETGGE